MKKLLLFIALMAVTLTASAQDKEFENIPLNADGAYEVKEVVTVDSVTKDILFGRAMEALSDWTGEDGRSKFGIDYSDKDAGTVIYKGNYYMGYYKTSLGGVIDAYINFILKVRCKDCKAQTTVISPSVTIKASGIDPVTKTMKEIVEAKKSGKKPNERQAKRTHMKSVRDCVQSIVKAMSNRLQMSQGDDDF